MSNFSKVWKVLLYNLISIIFIGGLTTAILLPIIEELSSAGLFSNLLSFFEKSLFNFSIANLGKDLFNIVQGFINTILALSSALQIRFFVGGGFIFLLSTVILGLKDLPITEEINKFMSSNSKIGFMTFYISKIGKNILLELTKLLIKIPFYVAVLIGGYYILSLFTLTNFVSLFAPFILIVFFVLMFALKNTLISGWLPAMAVRDVNVCNGFKFGFKAMSHRFFRTLSSLTMINFILIISNVIIFLLTGGAGLIISIPASTTYILIFNCVMYYGSMGMRYYVDLDTILSPKKLEEQDTFKHQKNII